jgi:hypothetical protein
MKIADLIKHAEKHEKQPVYAVYELQEELGFFGLGMPEAEEERFSSVMPIKWYCTDTWVGLKFYYFDNEFICMSSQLGRKGKKGFEWISKEIYTKVYDFFKSFDNLYVPEIETVELNKDIDDHYHVKFYNQLLVKCGIHKNRRVEILENAEEKYKNISQKALIKYIDTGEEEIVKVSDIDLEYFA